LLTLVMLAAGGATGADAAGAETTDADKARAETPPLDELLVTGERPGPGMWRIRRGDHDLWILGSFEPLPKAMRWHSEQAEARIEASQEVIAPPDVDTDIGFFRGLSLLPALLRARHSPDGERLEQALPHELYMRWLALRVKYLGGSDDEHLRPMLAALDLYRHALDAAGLRSDDEVWNSVKQTAEHARIPIQAVTVKLHIADPKSEIRDLDEVSRDAEIACLETTIDRLETDLGAMRERANLWSLGDVAALRARVHPDQHIACLNAVFTVPALRAQFEAAKRQVDEAWLAAADAALQRHASSFAVLPLREMLQSGGWLEQLAARGYQIEDPDP